MKVQWMIRYQDRRTYTNMKELPHSRRVERRERHLKQTEVTHKCSVNPSAGWAAHTTASDEHIRADAAESERDLFSERVWTFSCVLTGQNENGFKSLWVWLFQWKTLHGACIPQYLQCVHVLHRYSNCVKTWVCVNYRIHESEHKTGGVCLCMSMCVALSPKIHPPLPISHHTADPAMVTQLSGLGGCSSWRWCNTMDEANPMIF